MPMIGDMMRKAMTGNRHPSFDQNRAPAGLRDRRASIVEQRPSIDQSRVASAKLGSSMSSLAIYRTSRLRGCLAKAFSQRLDCPAGIDFLAHGFESLTNLRIENGAQQAVVAGF
jgi:hypothetical protein